MAWGIEANVIERFASAGIPPDNVWFLQEKYTFSFPAAPAELADEFRRYHGETMDAFEAAEKNGRADDLRKESVALFESQNTSPRQDATLIPATFLRNGRCGLGTLPISPLCRSQNKGNYALFSRAWTTRRAPRPKNLLQQHRHIGDLARYLPISHLPSNRMIAQGARQQSSAKLP
jgi:hypothetical protein